MDNRLKQALDFSNYMVTLNNQKRILKEQYQNNVIHYHNGGQFTVTPGLVSFCQSLLALHQSNTVLIDDNDIPIEIDDLEKFLEDINSKYFEAANQYFAEYNKIKANRSIESIMDL